MQTPLTRLRLKFERIEDIALRSRLIDDLDRMQALVRQGLDFSREKFEALQDFNNAAWRHEVIEHEELFILLHDHLPKEMVYERELLICRL